MKITGRDKITMDDGKDYYVNRGIIGLDPNLSITEGYDGGFSNFDADPDYGNMPDQHRREIAAYMISLWTLVLNGEPEKKEL